MILIPLLIIAGIFGLIGTIVASIKQEQKIRQTPSGFPNPATQSKRFWINFALSIVTVVSAIILALSNTPWFLLYFIGLLFLISKTATFWGFHFKDLLRK